MEEPKHTKFEWRFHVTLCVVLLTSYALLIGGFISGYLEW